MPGSEGDWKRIAGGSSDGSFRIVVCGSSSIIVRVTGWVKLSHWYSWKIKLQINSFGVAFLNIKFN